MKDYYYQLGEIRIAERRRNTLIEKKLLLETRITKTTSSLKEVVSFGTGSNDKLTRYVAELEIIEKELAEVEEKLAILRKNFHEMESAMKHLIGIEERIFRLYYIERKNPIQISMILGCGKTTVYRYLGEIKKSFKK